MSTYIRPPVTGARVFFTVCLAHRGSDLLVREVGVLRRAVAETRAERPFEILAFVVLPDHMHAVWQMPVGDKAYGVRWGAIKSRFSRGVLRKHGWPKDRETVGWNPTLLAKGDQRGRVGFHPTTSQVPRSASKWKKGDAGIWQRRFWEHHIRDEAALGACIRYCCGNPVKHGLVARAGAWPYSSLHRDIRRGLVEPECAGAVAEMAEGPVKSIQIRPH